MGLEPLLFDQREPMKIRIKAVSALLLAASLVLGLAGCGNDTPAAPTSGAAEKVTVKVGYQAAADYGLFYIGQEKGWFAEEGVELDLLVFTAGDAQIEALANGSTDLSLQGAQPALIATQRGVADLRMIGPIADSASLFSVISDPSIKTVEDLKGKKVAFQIGSAYEYYLDNVLASHNMTQADIEVVNLNPLDGQGAFLSKNVDAVVPLATSRYTILEARPDANVLFDADSFAKAPNPLTYSVYDMMIVNAKALDAKRDAMNKIVKVFYTKIIPYVTDAATKDEAIKALTDWQANVIKAKTDEKTVKQLIDSYTFYDLDRAKEVMTDGTFNEQVTNQAKFLVDAGTLPALPDIDKLVDSSVVEAA